MVDDEAGHRAEGIGVGTGVAAGKSTATAQRDQPDAPFLGHAQDFALRAPFAEHHVRRVA